MKDFKIGNHVKLTQYGKNQLNRCSKLGYHLDPNFKISGCNYCSSEHVNEFGNSIGRITNINKYGDIEVLWIPGNLKYNYVSDFLQKVNLAVFS